MSHAPKETNELSIRVDGKSKLELKLALCFCLDTHHLSNGLVSPLLSRVKHLLSEGVGHEESIEHLLDWRRERMEIWLGSGEHTVGDPSPHTHPFDLALVQLPENREFLTYLFGIPRRDCLSSRVRVVSRRKIW